MTGKAVGTAVGGTGDGVDAVTEGDGAVAVARATGVAAGDGWVAGRPAGVGVGDGPATGVARGVARGVGDGRAGEGTIAADADGVAAGVGISAGVGVGEGADGSTSGAVIGSSRAGGTCCATTGVASGRRARAVARIRIAQPVQPFRRHASYAATKRAAPATGRRPRPSPRPRPIAPPFDNARRGAYIGVLTTAFRDRTCRRAACRYE